MLSSELWIPEFKSGSGFQNLWLKECGQKTQDFKGCTGSPFKFHAFNAFTVPSFPMFLWEHLQFRYRKLCDFFLWWVTSKWLNLLFFLKVTFDLSNSFCHQNLGVIQLMCDFSCGSYLRCFWPKLPWRKGPSENSQEIGKGRMYGDSAWWRLGEGAIIATYINVTFYFFLLRKSCDDGNGLHFQNLDLLSTDPSNLHRRGLNDGQRRKSEKTKRVFSVATCCGVWKGRKFVKVHFLPQK